VTEYQVKKGARGKAESAREALTDRISSEKKGSCPAQRSFFEAELFLPAGSSAEERPSHLGVARHTDTRVTVQRFI
jgi:hypothetical protein